MTNEFVFDGRIYRNDCSCLKPHRYSVEERCCYSMAGMECRYFSLDGPGVGGCGFPEETLERLKVEVEKGRD